jgi:3-phenylpropionate/cinnamic acid dioxygenase small subunit
MELLDVLRVEREIRAVYLKFCELIDSKDYERLAEVFTEDCQRSYRDPAGNVEVRDIDAAGQPNNGLSMLVRRLKLTLDENIVTQHNFTNLIVTIHSADSVSARCHFNAVHRQRGNPEIFSIWGQYADEFRLAGGGWRSYARQYDVWLTEGPDFVLGGRQPLAD